LSRKNCSTSGDQLEGIFSLGSGLMIILDTKLEGRLQIAAALALLSHSRLVRWVPDGPAAQREAFEATWPKDVYPVFGRVICWILFSAGAELLAKGVCLACGIDLRDLQDVPEYPRGNLDAWAAAFLPNNKASGTVTVPDFGTLRRLYQGEDGKPAALKQLCKVKNASPDAERRIAAAYTLLARSIRNRDAHAYIPNVRDQHHSLVPVLFTDIFNLLISWVEGGMQTVETWRRDAGSFIEMLRQPLDRAEDDTELAALIARLKLLNDLHEAQTLSLGSDVTNNGLRSLNAFPSLTTLILQSTLVTDAGLEELRHLTKLAELKIYSAPITNKGLMHLAQIPNLHRLFIAAKRVTPQGVAQLQAMRPDLKLMH
jgi:hypothetical protein